MLDLRIQAAGSGNAYLSENMPFNRAANIIADKIPLQGASLDVERSWNHLIIAKAWAGQDQVYPSLQNTILPVWPVPRDDISQRILNWV